MHCSHDFIVPGSSVELGHAVRLAVVTSLWLSVNSASSGTAANSLIKSVVMISDEFEQYTQPFALNPSIKELSITVCQTRLPTLLLTNVSPSPLYLRCPQRRAATRLLQLCSCSWLSRPVPVCDTVPLKRHPSRVSGCLSKAVFYIWKDPVLSTITPSFGPIAGGTLLTVGGSDLNTGTSQLVHLGNQPCTLIRYLTIHQHL